MKAKRKLVKLDVSFISLVTKGANGHRIICKSDKDNVDNLGKTIKIVKTNDDEQLVYGIVYSPDMVDSQGDFATAEVIKEAAHNFLKNKNNDNIDLQHSYVKGEGGVVESYVTQKNDERFPEVSEGSWAVVIKIENDETWESIKNGDIGGISMAGVAEVEEVQKHNVVDTIKSWFSFDKAGKAISSNTLSQLTEIKDLLVQLIDRHSAKHESVAIEDESKNKIKKGEIMDEEKVKAMIEKSHEDLISQITELKTDIPIIKQVLEKLCNLTSSSKVIQDVNKTEVKQPNLWI